MTPQQARKIALSFPGVEETPHRGHPSFRVRKKIFATLRPDQQQAVLKLDLADQKDLISQYPGAFSLNAWSYQGWTNVHLRHVSVALFRVLAADAWHRVAPKSVKSDKRSGGKNS